MNWVNRDNIFVYCSGQFTEYFQRVVVKLKALIAMLEVQTSTRLDNLIYAYGKKLNKKKPKLTTHSDKWKLWNLYYMFCAVSTGKVQKQHCESNPPDTKLFQRQNHVRLSHVIQHSPTSCAQFDPKRVSAYNRPRSISVYRVRPLVDLNIYTSIQMHAIF